MLVMSSSSKKAMILEQNLQLSSRLQPDALSLLRQVLPEVQLDELQGLLGIVGLIHQRVGEGQVSPVPGCFDSLITDTVFSSCDFLLG